MLLRNTIYNLIGLGAPLLVAVVSIPLLISALGTDRFGLLTLVWAVVSYFGLFDMGLGRALTQQLAVTLAREEHEKVGPLIATATTLMAVLGVLAGLLMAAGAVWGVGLIQAVPDRHEAEAAVYAMAVGMPFIVLTAGWRGVLEARQAFCIINLIRVPMGLFTFLGPLAVVVYGEPRLDWVASVLVAGRVLACAIHAYFAWRVLPVPRGTWRWRTAWLRPLCVSGGWLTVSNVVSPFMGYVDRFVIGSLVSAAAVAYYVTPQELMTKLWIVPGALTSVLFPMFAAAVNQQSQQTWDTLTRSVRWLLALLFPITLVIALFARELLGLWVGNEFSKHSAVLLQVFAAGILINCLAHVPFTLIQGGGQARTGAIIHCIEFPFFVLALMILTWRFGALGAALAWLLRMLVDAGLMFHFGGRMVNRPPGTLASPMVIGMGLLVALGFAGVAIESAATRVAWSMFSVLPLLLLIREHRARTTPCA